MNGLIDLAVKQPITVAVGVILAVLAGLLSASRMPIQMTPTVDSVVISVNTTWENASAAEIESDVIEEREERLSNLTGLVSMTSVSQAGSGNVRLEFRTGTDINEALAEVDQKLSEVPGYPEGVDQPVVEDIDPESIDYIAWIGLGTSDPQFDATTPRNPSPSGPAYQQAKVAITRPASAPARAAVASGITRPSQTPPAQTPAGQICKL